MNVKYKFNQTENHLQEKNNIFLTGEMPLPESAFTKFSLYQVIMLYKVFNPYRDKLTPTIWEVVYICSYLPSECLSS